MDKKYYPLVGAIILIALVLPATIYLVLRSQETRSKAAPVQNCIRVGNPFKGRTPCCPGLTAQWDKWSRRYLCLPVKKPTPTNTPQLPVICDGCRAGSMTSCFTKEGLPGTKTCVFWAYRNCTYWTPCQVLPTEAWPTKPPPPPG